ncbi:phosphoribosylformylglycinamidine synthase-like [Coturnix japonica]|uniref:phosphoribosylformylglycinamidine synthase-like n=1 Tax=Coturnix japonica TaxID=93934 RepID=UPI000777CEF6|nr:phosphoribosylformylglycinamidine synthase-like [Coturnix japonica]
MKVLGDPMTEQPYPTALSSFHVPIKHHPITHIDVIGAGSRALEEADKEMGLAFDPWDVQFYTQLFRRAGRNPTNVECFDIAQSNSEHSRHWFFKGRLEVDGRWEPRSLFESIMATQGRSNDNNVIKFCDNSSAIRGAPVLSLLPMDPGRPSMFHLQRSTRHILFTAETHNFPTGNSLINPN